RDLAFVFLRGTEITDFDFLGVYSSSTGKSLYAGNIGDHALQKEGETEYYKEFLNVRIGLSEFSDIDGDGSKDFFYYERVNNFISHVFYTGKGNETLHTGSYGEPEYSDYRRASIIGDLDKDGFPEFGVYADSGIFTDLGKTWHGGVLVYSSSSGQRVNTIKFPAQELLSDPYFAGKTVTIGSFGTDFYLTPDVNGDGVDDLVVFSTLIHTPNPDGLSGILFTEHIFRGFYSGADSSLISYQLAELDNKVLNGQNNTHGRAGEVRLFDDINGDQVPDLLFYRPCYKLGLSVSVLQAACKITALSGADLSVIYNYEYDESETSWASQIGTSRIVGDIDFDGIRDFSILYSKGSTTLFAADFFSGKSGNKIGSIDFEGDEVGLGHDIRVIDDLDGDGRAEIVVYQRKGLFDAPQGYLVLSIKGKVSVSSPFSCSLKPVESPPASPDLAQTINNCKANLQEGEDGSKVIKPVEEKLNDLVFSQLSPLLKDARRKKGPLKKHLSSKKKKKQRKQGRKAYKSANKILKNYIASIDVNSEFYGSDISLPLFKDLSHAWNSLKGAKKLDWKLYRSELLNVRHLLDDVYYKYSFEKQ
ncbi:MAG: hypothetical protein KDD53_06100, partial [Bdellovibrionales bacterium]|nr:hypothetical protein [Bdellovibrionales bacterium]